MKKSTKTIAGVLIGLAAASVIGVGFSAWVINQTNTAEVTGITVAVADTTDKSVLITDAVVSEGAIRFDAPSTKTEGKITYQDDGQGGEDLYFTITYKLNVGANATACGVKASLALNGTSDANTAYTSAKTANYFVEPISTNTTIMTSSTATPAAMGSEGSAIYTTYTAGTDTSVYKVYNVTTVFKFSWGTAFGGMNPANYADEDGVNLETVVAALNTLKTASGAALKVTLESSTAAL